MTPSSRPSFATASGVPPDLAMASAIALISRTCSVLTAGCNARTAAEGPAAATGALRKLRTESTAPLRTHELPASTPLIRLWAVNGMKLGADLRKIAPADAVFLLREHHDGTALW